MVLGEHSFGVVETGVVVPDSAKCISHMCAQAQSRFYLL